MRGVGWLTPVFHSLDFSILKHSLEFCGLLFKSSPARPAAGLRFLWWVVAVHCLIINCWGQGPADLPLSNLPRRDYWMANGAVNAALETNGVIYLGGAFTELGGTNTGKILAVF
jgi:hypothetical protein